MTNFDNHLILENISQIFKTSAFYVLLKTVIFQLEKIKKNGPGYTKGYLLIFFDSIIFIPGSIDALGDNYSQ